jgi:OmcA/MtrC family decaheme c-type cytochrome
MLSGGLGYTYNLTSALPLTQRGVSEPIGSNSALGTPRFGVSPSPVFPTNADRLIGGLIVVTPDKQVVASAGAAAGGTGGAYTDRRPIVDDAKCNNCHKELGLFTAESFHGGQRNDGTTCAWCHTPNRTSSGWSADASYYIHAIHGSDKREKKFTWHATAVGKSYDDIQFPGILNRCETCHVPGSYDFSSAAASSALPKRLYKTVATGIFNATAGTTTTTYSYNAGTGTCVAGTSSPQTDLGVYSLSLPYITALNNYGIGFSFNSGLSTSNSCKPDGTVVSIPAGGTVEADPTTLVISPIATACFSCHDSDIAKQHMENEGASIYRPRSQALGKAELCMFCHSPSSVYGLGIKAVHDK